VSAPPKHRILHLITRLELGGAQQNTLYCMRHHDRERFDVELIAGAGGPLDEAAREIPRATVQIVDWLEHAISPWHDLVALLRLRGYLRSAKIQLLHTHSSKAGFLGRFAGRLVGVPAIVHTVHGWSFNDEQPGWKRSLYVMLERLAARWTDKMIVVSARNRDKGLALGIGRPDQYLVIHSGIDVAEFRTSQRPREEVRRSLGFDPDDIVVGTIACLKPQKAPLDFVRAAAAAHAECPQLRFFIAGDGELRSAVEREVERLGLTDVVRLLGWRHDVPDLLHAMDLFLLTSLFEGLPRAVLQAMAAGIPVIATEVDGTPEVVEQDVTGLLVPPGDPDATAAALVRAAGDADLRKRLVEAAQRRLDDSFEIQRMVGDLDRLYVQLLSERPAR